MSKSNIHSGLAQSQEELDNKKQKRIWDWATDVAGSSLGRSHTEAVSRNGPSDDFLQYSRLR
jgi:hypothetical protein